METITISKDKFLQMKREINTLRNSSLYKKVLQSNRELKEKIYTREDIGL